MRARIDNRLADFRPEFDDGLMHLRLDLLLERDLPAFKNFLDVGTQLPRLRIDNGEFLLDAERVAVILGAHGGRQTSLKNTQLSSRVAQPTRDLTIRIGSHKPASRDTSHFVRSFAPLRMTRD